MKPKRIEVIPFPTLDIDLTLLSINWKRVLRKLNRLPKSESECVRIRHLLLHSKLDPHQIVTKCRKLLSRSMITSKH